MSKDTKAKFRQSKAWKEFRKEVYYENPRINFLNKEER